MFGTTRRIFHVQHYVHVLDNKSYMFVSFSYENIRNSEKIDQRLFTGGSWFFFPNQFTNTTRRRRETSFDSVIHTRSTFRKLLIFLCTSESSTTCYNTITICDLCLRRENRKIQSGNRSSRSSDVKCNIVTVTTVISARTDDMT